MGFDYDILVAIFVQAVRIWLDYFRDSKDEKQKKNSSKKSSKSKN